MYLLLIDEATGHRGEIVDGMAKASQLLRLLLGCEFFNQQSSLNNSYQSPQCDAVICWNFIFQTSPCFTQTVVKC